ncbi:MAG TPA: hypothetical protein VM121_00620 [Acidimicrobiales bacterium]|nr:hypothetical protein [Acidimicrobiales bacterium]
MSATLAVRHSVADYATWLVAYKEAETIRDKHGCTAEQVYRLPADGNDVFVTHDFPTAAQAEAFAADPDLSAAMERGGVTSAPRIEIFERA